MANSDADITGFFPKESQFTVQSSEHVKILSDPEGYHIRQLANDNPSNKLLVLGDLMDYTLGRGGNFNNFASGNLTQLREAKSHSFESIKYCLDNKDRIKVMFGNRDLNKLKLMPLALITDQEGKYVKYWNPKEVMASPKNDYYSGALTLIELMKNNKYNWAIPTLENWKPFWKLAKPKDKDTYEYPAICNHWNQNARLESSGKMSCLERFYLIFGLDCEHGTISAQNTLFGVAQECGRYSQLFGRFTEFLSQTTTDEKGNKKLINDNNFLLKITDSDLKKNLEIAAALVFTVFADSLYGANPTPEKPFSGVLREFFLANNTYYCAYAKLGNDLLTFSHGGMRAEFFKCAKEPGQKLTDLIAADNMLKPMVSEQLGGYSGTTTDVLGKDLVTGRITDYNKEMKEGLRKLINEYVRYINIPGRIPNKATLELLLNLTISAPYKGSSSCIHESASPIMPGVVGPGGAGGYREKPIIVSDATLYQFIGHAPTGFAPLIDKYTESSNGGMSFLINLDISNSLMGQYGLLDMSKVDTNYSYVSVGKESGELKIKSNTNVIITPQKISNIPEQTISEIKITDCNLLDLPAEFDSEYSMIDIGGGKKIHYNYHGVINHQGKTYYFFTYVPGYDPQIVLVPSNKVAELKNMFRGGRSSRRNRKQKANVTGKHRRGANKLYVRTSRTLVRRRANRRTAKK